jgi:hypothetical protein
MVEDHMIRQVLRSTVDGTQPEKILFRFLIYTLDVFSPYFPYKLDL